MKVKKILISLFFFSNLFLLDSSNTKTSKAMAILSAIALSKAHNYVVSLHNKKPIVDDLFVEKAEKTLSQEIYSEVFCDIPVVEILTSLYKESTLSYSKLNQNNDALVVAKNCNLFGDALLASFFLHEFIGKINEKKKLSNMEQRALVGSFSIGIMRGLVYSLIEEQIDNFVQIVPCFKEKKTLRTLVTAILNVVITKGLLNKILYRSIRYFFVEKNNLKLSFANRLNEDTIIEESNEEAKNEIKTTDFIEVVDLGTLQAKILIYLIRIIDQLRK